MRKSIQSLFRADLLPMHELVHHTVHTRLRSALRRPSFAGNGLPERMRSISFAVMGLTAAAGLALVALFAQPSFPLLAPAPLPAEPSAHESVSAAKRLPQDHASVALLTALPAPAHSGHSGAGATGGNAGGGTSASGGSGGGESGGQAAPAGVDAPVPVPAPQPSNGNDGGGKAGSGAGGGSVPAPAAQQPAATPSAPATPTRPSNPKPETVTSAPKPEPAPAPGNSSSAAAAEHASERGIEASGGAGPPASVAASAPPAEPEDSAAPGNGNGLAKGHDK